MSIFGGLFGSSSSPEIIDPVFGRLILESSVWTGSIRAGGQLFRVFVIAGPEGPSARQRSFFVISIERLPKLIDIALILIRRQTHTISIPDLQLYAIEVGPDIEVAEHRLTIEFSPAGENEIHRVEFKDLEALSYGCDD